MQICQRSRHRRCGQHNRRGRHAEGTQYTEQYTSLIGKVDWCLICCDFSQTKCIRVSIALHIHMVRLKTAKLSGVTTCCEICKRRSWDIAAFLLPVLLDYMYLENYKQSRCDYALSCFLQLFMIQGALMITNQPSDYSSEQYMRSSIWCC